jgi:hypothetical protein
MKSLYGEGANIFTRRIFILQKTAVRYTAGLKHLESCRGSFRLLQILTVYPLHIQETVVYGKQKCKCTVNIYTWNSRNSYKYIYRIRICNCKSWVTGHIFYNKLPNNIKQVDINSHLRKELKDCLLNYAIIQYNIISM